MSLILIVEGQSEVESLPIIIRRLLDQAGLGDVIVGKPVRVKRNKIVKEGELERVIQLVFATRENCDSICIVLDADDDCPYSLGQSLRRRSDSMNLGVPVSIVIPCKELEAWFLGSLSSLDGKYGISVNAHVPTNPENVRGAKERLSDLMSEGYIEVYHQPKFASLFDVGECLNNCPSFDKFHRDIVGKIAAYLSGYSTNVPPCFEIHNM
jgi:hypothetical protein